MPGLELGWKLSSQQFTLLELHHNLFWNRTTILYYLASVLSILTISLPRVRNEAGLTLAAEPTLIRVVQKGLLTDPLDPATTKLQHLRSIQSCRRRHALPRSDLLLFLARPAIDGLHGARQFRRGYYRYRMV